MRVSMRECRGTICDSRYMTLVYASVCACGCNPCLNFLFQLHGTRVHVLGECKCVGESSAQLTAHDTAGETIEWRRQGGLQERDRQANKLEMTKYERARPVDMQNSLHLYLLQCQHLPLFFKFVHLPQTCADGQT
jgi:hypothetical protein